MRRLPCCLLLAAALLGPASAATISSYLESYVALADGNWSARFGQQDHYEGYGSWSASDSSTTSASQAALSAAVGALKLHASGSYAAGFNQAAAAQSLAGFSYGDVITVAANGHAGQLALMNLQFYVPGTTAIELHSAQDAGSSFAGFLLNAGLYGQQSFFGEYRDEKRDERSPSLSYHVEQNTLPSSRVVNVATWVTLGSTAQLALNGRVLGSGWVSWVGSGSYEVDYSHSLYFAGINSLRLANGTEITDFTATGEDGMDYRRSYVPATTTVPDGVSTALTVGMVGVGLWGWRRRAIRHGCGANTRDTISVHGLS